MWIAIHFPQLPLDVVLRSWCEQGETPAVVSENRRIGWCNRAAEEAGIVPGMSDANARALAGTLHSFGRDLPREAQALQEAALAALRFTPHVTLRPSGFLMEVSASLKLFKGAQSIASQLLSTLAELKLDARLAGAPTATGAWLRAQWDGLDSVFESDLRRGLDPLPVAVLDTAGPHLDTLEGIGCRTLGQLRALPRTGLTRRFGRELLRELDRAYGEEAEAYAWFEAPDVFDARLELPARVESTEALLFAARRLLWQLAGWLTARHAAVLGITLVLHHESMRHRDHRRTPVVITLASPSRDAEHLSLLLRERLALLELRSPVCELSLQADQLVTQAAPNAELFPTPASEADTLARLVERLQSRLGMQAVRRIESFPDHRPEKSVLLPAVTERARTRKESGTPHVDVLRPTWLLAQPLPLTTRHDQPFYQSPLHLLTGPERIESGWWDDEPVTRDYFVAENAQHQLLWVYRLRPLRGDGSGWFLHGFFG